jgi:hypothetical protein
MFVRMVLLPFNLQAYCKGWPGRMRYDAGFRWRMGRASLNIVLSVAGAGVVGFAVLVLLETMLPGNALFRIQVSSTVAMGVFAGAAIVIYVRLAHSRYTRRK